MSQKIFGNTLFLGGEWSTRRTATHDGCAGTRYKRQRSKNLSSYGDRGNGGLNGERCSSPKRRHRFPLPELIFQREGLVNSSTRSQTANKKQPPCNLGVGAPSPSRPAGRQKTPASFRTPPNDTQNRVQSRAIAQKHIKRQTPPGITHLPPASKNNFYLKFTHGFPVSNIWGGGAGCLTPQREARRQPKPSAQFPPA